MLAVGTLWWILLTVIVIIGLLWSVDKCHPIFATISFIVYLAILQWLSHVPILATITEHPSVTIGLIGAYLATGICWSFLRWWLYIRQVFSGKRPHWIHGDMVSYKETWLSNYRRGRERVAQVAAAQARAVMNHAARVGGEAPQEVVAGNADTNLPAHPAWMEEARRIKPKAVEHKGLISIWVIYWPFSALWSLIEDLIHEIIKAIVTKLRIIYDAIGNSAMKGAA
jgi:hypothetical protein